MFQRSMLVLTLAASNLTAASAPAPSHGPQVRDVAIDRAGARVSLTISWPNAFRNERNHDAAWLVLRGADPTRGPLRLATLGHTVRPIADGDRTPEGALEIADDRLGVFVHAAAPHRGPVAWQVTLAVDEALPEVVTACAVAMVYVPSGAFDLGDDDARVVAHGAFFASGNDNGVGGVLRVADEREIAVGNAPGDLWYQGDPNGYRGDRGGPIPRAWPKGTRAFYVMRRELTQGEYAAFLNALPAQWQQRRAPLALDGEETETCSIARGADGAFVASAPDRPCNFVCWDDSAALFDWLALRPITEFEFEKSARGPARPLPADFPWGTGDVAKVERRVLAGRDLAAAGVDDEAALDDASKERLAASHYYVMDLAGSLWERVISAGHPVGRAFQGSHGDGVLSPAGDATNADWPRQDARGGDAPGIGYRGGAEYFQARRADGAIDPTNPFSFVATRTYGAWGGAHRYKTYGARAGRTAGPAALARSVR